MQVKFASPNEYYPTWHALQSSVADVAPTLVDVLPEGQFIPKQTVNEPPVEYVPAKQLVHPSVADVAPSFVAFLPASHVIGVQLIGLPASD